MKDTICVGSLIVREPHTGTYKATVIYEDREWVYIFHKWCANQMFAQAWVEDNGSEMPRYFDRRNQIRK